MQDASAGRESGHKVPPLVKKKLATDGRGEKKKKFSLRVWHLGGIDHTLAEGLTPSGQYKLYLMGFNFF